MQSEHLPASGMYTSSLIYRDVKTDYTKTLMRHLAFKRPPMIQYLQPSHSEQEINNPQLLVYFHRFQLMRQYG